MTAAVASVWIVVGACALLVSLWLWFCTDTRMNALEDRLPPEVEPIAVPVTAQISSPRVGGQHRTKAHR